MAIPNLPRGIPFGIEVIEVLFVLEGVHAGPEPIVLMRDQLLFRDETLKGLMNEFFTIFQILENLSFEDEISTINAQGAFVDVLNVGNQTTSIYGDEMIAEVGAHAKKTGDLVMLAKMFDVTRKRQIRKAVTVIREKRFFPFQILLDRFEALPHVGRDAGVGEGDAPVMNIPIYQVDILSASGEDKIVGDIFIIFHEVVFDGIRAMAKTKDKVFVTVVRVVFHDVPQNRTIPNGGHRFRNVFRIVSQTQTKSTTKENDFHGLSPF